VSGPYACTYCGGSGLREEYATGPDGKALFDEFGVVEVLEPCPVCNYPGRKGGVPGEVWPPECWDEAHTSRLIREAAERKARQKA
jgi:hypothetical protein